MSSILNSSARILARSSTKPSLPSTSSVSLASSIAARSLVVPSRPALLPAREPGPVSEPGPPKQGIFRSLLHGSEDARQAGLTAQSHSTSVARGKYIHEIQRHEVRPEQAEEYKALIADLYPKIAGDKDIGVRLTGSWEVTVGDLDTFYHIWEYDGYAGYDKAEQVLASHPIRTEGLDKLRPLIKGRSNWLTQEFAFWASSPPQTTNGLYELRTYHLKPGHLLEWEQHWRRGLEARRKFVEPIGAWFTQIGGLHTVFHVWEYPSLEARKETRDQAWSVDTWSETVSETVKLIDRMHAQIMRPLPFSPLK